MTRNKSWAKQRIAFSGVAILGAGLMLQGCKFNEDDVKDAVDNFSEVSDDTGSTSGDTSEDTTGTTSNADVIDITNSIFTERSGDCAGYSNALEASVLDISQNMGFEASMLISNTNDSCTFVSNSIPNHDFDDASAHFATPTAEYALELSISRSPAIAASTSSLTQQTEDAIFLNGVVLDILSAGCYDPSKNGADANGNTAIGCNTDDPWLMDPLGSDTKFGADAHNAHTQPTGQYHYHGNPEAMFDNNPGPNGSPVIGFAGDGFPIYGSYFLDSDTGSVRKATSGFTLKAGNRVAINGLNPSDNGNSESYDGTYVADWEYTNTGDLDECNGMAVDGQYGYYVTDTYPWVLACFKGTIHESFYKNGGGAPAEDTSEQTPVGEVNADCPEPGTLPEPNGDGSMPPPPEGCPLPDDMPPLV